MKLMPPVNAGAPTAPSQKSGREDTGRHHDADASVEKFVDALRRLARQSSGEVSDALASFAARSGLRAGAGEPHEGHGPPHADTEEHEASPHSDLVAATEVLGQAFSLALPRHRHHALSEENEKDAQSAGDAKASDAKTSDAKVSHLLCGNIPRPIEDAPIVATQPIADARMGIEKDGLEVAPVLDERVAAKRASTAASLPVGDQPRMIPAALSDGTAAEMAMRAEERAFGMAKSGGNGRISLEASSNSVTGALVVGHETHLAPADPHVSLADRLARSTDAATAVPAPEHGAPPHQDEVSLPHPRPPISGHSGASTTVGARAADTAATRPLPKAAPGSSATAPAVPQQLATALVETLEKPDRTAPVPAQPASVPDRPVVRVLQVALEPAELGRVEIRLQLAGQALRVRVGAERVDTARVIAAESHVIRRILSDHGYVVESITAQSASLAANGTAQAVGGHATPQGAPLLQGDPTGSGRQSSGRSDAWSDERASRKRPDDEEEAGGSGRRSGLYV